MDWAATACTSCAGWATRRSSARTPRNAVPGVDAWCDVELAFPGGATGLCANSMVADDYSFTLRIVGTEGERLVHDFIKPTTTTG